MVIWREVDGVSAAASTGPTVAALGMFDGVHRGHAAVLSQARALAHRRGPTVPVVAVTFDPHPIAIFAPEREPARLTSLARRRELLRAAGADEVRVLAFDREMAAWSPEEFVDRVLVEQLSVSGVVVGQNFTYGRRASGTVDTLTQQGADRGFEVASLDLVGDDAAWSSSRVRELVAAGRVDEAAAILGRPFAVEGEVVTGDQRGRELGYPTANVPALAGWACPADGVYAGWFTRPSGERLPVAISVGTNPTFDGADRRVESYVIGGRGLDLYGEFVRVEFIARLRPMERFDGLDALIEQMDRDVAAAAAILGVPNVR